MANIAQTVSLTLKPICFPSLETYSANIARTWQSIMYVVYSQKSFISFTTHWTKFLTLLFLQQRRKSFKLEPVIVIQFRCCFRPYNYYKRVTNFSELIQKLLLKNALNKTEFYFHATYRK